MSRNFTLVIVIWCGKGVLACLTSGIYRLPPKIRRVLFSNHLQCIKIGTESVRSFIFQHFTHTLRTILPVSLSLHLFRISFFSDLSHFRPLGHQSMGDFDERRKKPKWGNQMVTWVPFFWELRYQNGKYIGQRVNLLGKYQIESCHWG